MSSLIEELKIKYKQFSISEKLIFINIGIFGFIAVCNAFYFLLTKEHFTFFNNYLPLPEDLKTLAFKPWTILSYMFTHSGFKHLLFNMIMLYFSGRIFLLYFSSRQLLSYYFLGGIVGGLVFIILYNIAPALIDDHMVLVGASASIFAILVGVTTMAPNYNVNLFGLLKIKLWVVSILFIISFISLIPGFNTGGELAHLGGALLGYLYTKRLQKGKDIGKPFEKIMDTFTSIFKKKSNLKTAYKSKTKVGGYTKGEFNEFNKQKQINLILDKISKSGYESLTEEEKAFLFRAGKD